MRFHPRAGVADDVQREATWINSVLAAHSSTFCKVNNLHYVGWLGVGCCEFAALVSRSPPRILHIVLCRGLDGRHPDYSFDREIKLVERLLQARLDVILKA